MDGGLKLLAQQTAPDQVFWFPLGSHMVRVSGSAIRGRTPLNLLCHIPQLLIEGARTPLLPLPNPLAVPSKLSWRGPAPPYLPPAHLEDGPFYDPLGNGLSTDSHIVGNRVPACHFPHLGCLGILPHLFSLLGEYANHTARSLYVESFQPSTHCWRKTPRFTIK